MKQKLNRKIDAKGRLPPEIDYAAYHFTRQELVMYFLSGGVFMAVVSWLFYDSVIALLLLMPVVVYLLKYRRQFACLKRRRRLEIEFREVILSVASNLQTGYSIENAFQESYRDIVLLYGSESVMAKELRLIFRKIGNNEPLEYALINLADRSGVRDI